MPSVTLSVEADAAVWSSGIGAGAGNHLPIGYWSTARYRSAMRFPKPSWSTWTAITKATLSFYISDHQHVGVRNSSIYVRRQNEGDLWTIAAGSQSCESGFTGGNTTQYDDLTPNSLNQVSFSSGTTANAKKSVTVTAQVQYYFGTDIAKIVFIFDPVGSDDYTELWADEKSGYNAELVIEYETESVPDAPTLVAPAAGATVDAQLPTFSWTHNDPQSDPQAGAQVEVYDAPGTTLLYTYTVVGTAGSVVGTDLLTRGSSYRWRARTSDAGGYGAWSSQQTFTIRATPVVVIDSVRRMVFANGAPRLVVQWTCDQPQTSYRVQSAGGYDSGVIASGVQTHTLTTLNLTSGTAETITVTVVTSYGLTGSDGQAFTPRYGLTTHRKDLTSAPTNWGTPVVVATVPTDATLQFEYGSDAAAIGAPTTWYPALSSAPLARYLFWRAWFIPNATTGPTLDKLTIPTDSAVTLLDKWGTTRDVAALVAPWKVAPSEAVYGTRSLTADVTGAGPFLCYSFAISVRAGRSYILTGLMKSQGNSGAQFRLEDAAGNILIGGGVTVPVGNVESEMLVATRDWFATDLRDVNRYKTPVWVAPSDMTVYVVARTGGTAGAKAWFDALKLEESTVATPWSPSAIGATVIDAGGVQIDGSRGGVFRYKGATGGTRDVVEGGPSGLVFGGDTEVTSPSDGALSVDGVPVMLAVVAAPIRNVYTALGASGWTKPAGLRYIEVECLGGGGAGGGCAATAASTNAEAGGGGSGAYTKKLFAASVLPSSCTATVGAGGTASTGAGGNGGASTFAGSGITTVSAGGGVGAIQGSGSGGNVQFAGGAGGTASGGDINSRGGIGGPGQVRAGVALMSGIGANSIWGQGAGHAVQAAGDTALGYGAGGGGAASPASTAARSGGAGSQGIVIVTEYY